MCAPGPAGIFPVSSCPMTTLKVKDEKEKAKGFQTTDSSVEKIPKGSKGIKKDAPCFLISRSALVFPKAGERRNHLGQKFLTWMPVDKL